MIILKIRGKLIYYYKKLLYLINSKIFLNTIQKRLGYPGNTRLLIIHADDMGFSGSQNAATIESMVNGMVNSGSIMVPCSKYQEIVEFAKNNKEEDLGIHLTLTNEWPLYKWGPVLPVDEVKSLIDRDGFLLKNKVEFLKTVIVSEVEKELRAQIKMALESGIDLTHIDSHMYIALTNCEIQNIYLALGREFRLPVLLPKEIYFQNFRAKNEVVVDNLYCAEPGHYVNGLNNYYSQILRTLKPGLSCLLVHPAYNDTEMQNITSGQTNFGASWRQADFDFFTSDECCKLIKDNNIQLITWREIRDKLIR
jgi:predicted glycoside hydrolase/deacetylase ChbG (UPF0249 family)